MVQRTSTWVKSNKEIIGWVFAALIYGVGLFIALEQKVSANETKDAVRDERISNDERRMNAYEINAMKMNDALQRIDKNVVEIKTTLVYKADK